MKIFMLAEELRMKALRIGFADDGNEEDLETIEKGGTKSE
jgi:hypothetical protein